jgi:tRNA(Ile)-lysidine synthase
VPTPNAPDARVARFLDDLTALTGPLPSTARIGVAVSGGPDSVALLLLAHAALPGQVVAATVDHGLRPEAAGEAAMVARLCDESGVPHSLLHPPEPIESGSNVQERARIARYRALAGWAGREGVAAVATAHHRDDVAESFLMRASRGSGLTGLARMRGVCPIPYAGDTAARLVRPLLGWSRTELAAIVQKAGIAAAQDPSNSDPRYDRVLMRDLLRQATPLDAESLAKAASNLADAEAALGWMVDLVWRSRVVEEAAGIQFDPDGLPVELRRRVAGRAMAALAADWNGEGLDTLIAKLDRGGTATLAGVKASGGAMWRFALAPARRDHR